MSLLGKVRIGHRAPDFHCDAVINGRMEEKVLGSYTSPNKPQWLIILFIPAAFSFVCPTEVLAFQNCLDEFRDRNCNVVFVSVDTKHSLWHWQNVPRQYGGLGQIDIDLLSDPSHKMSRDYGVLIEEEGVCLRGLFIVDDKAIVQQVTLNNLTVGRSVLEALRLLEAFQAVAKHGVLCPIDWKPSTNTSDTINTISNMLTESYDERLANLQKEFGDMPITDLDAKHKSPVSTPTAAPEPAPSATAERSNSASTTSMVRRSIDNPDNIAVTMTYNASGKLKEDNETQRNNDLKHTTNRISTRTPSTEIYPPRLSRNSSSLSQSMSASSSPSPTPMPTPTPAQSSAPPPTPKKAGFGGTARHSRGHASAHPGLHTPNTYNSRLGTQVILEFADPTCSPQVSPSLSHTLGQSLAHSPLSTPGHRDPHPHRASYRSNSSRNSSPSQSIPSPYVNRSGGQMSWRMPTPPVESATASPMVETPTRLQATFEAIKKMSGGLSSPRWIMEKKKESEGSKSAEEQGYFDVVPEIVEA